MFTRARITLTAWYVAIIMAVSLAFSIFIFIGATHEYDRILRMQQFRIEHPQTHIEVFQGVPRIESFSPPPRPDAEVIEQARMRLLISLFGVNTMILLFSALAGYFLAGQTLRPIKEMVADQNRFITDASHELNTPLTAIQTTTEVNLRDKALTVAKAKQVLESNLEEISNLQKISEELIHLTKYESSKFILAKTTVDIKTITQSAITKILPLANAKNIKVTTSVGSQQVLAQEKSLKEVFIILLDNAIKYSPEKSTVSVFSKVDNKEIRIFVKDEGLGIAPEDIKHVFDRFYRSDKSRTKQEIPGFGLGLSIAKRIATAHKGTLTVESNSKNGSIFCLSLPITS